MTIKQKRKYKTELNRLNSLLTQIVILAFYLLLIIV